MSVISHNDVSQFYKKDSETGWYSVDFGSVRYKEQAQEISTQCVSDARLERLKAVGKSIMAGGTALGLGIAAIIAFKIASLVIGIFAFPLAIIPPLYSLVTLLGALGVGATVFTMTIEKYSKDFFNQAKEHWEYGNHLYAEAHRARLEIPNLRSAAK